MTLFHKSNLGSKSKSKRKRLGSLAECWAGIGLWVGIWAVTYGIIASGRLPI